MHNPIIGATLSVFAFWWGVALLLGFWEHGKPDQWLHLDNAITASMVGATSFAIAAFAIWGRRWIGQGGLIPTQARGAECTIGPIPGMIPMRRASRPFVVDEKRWPTVSAWEKTAPDAYAKAFQAILKVLAAHPDFPASPVPGGHGNLSLIEHTLNVVEKGLSMVEKWAFDRRPNDPLMGCPIPKDSIPVLALILAGHDIGKLEAFALREGKVEEWKRSHDREGARMLASLEEIWNIPEDDRKALIAVVAHEHHPQDLPVHLGDEVRLLLEFLIHSDAEASREEEGKAKEAEASSSEEAAQATPEDDAESEALWAWFLDFIAKPGTINGKDKRFRVGFKRKDGLIILNEPDIRRAMAEHFDKNPLVAENRKGDGRYVITERLMKVLADKGVLLQTWNGLQFSHKNALFRVVAKDRHGKKVIGEWSAAIIVDLGDHMPHHIKVMSPAPHAPEIVEAVFAQRAFKKKTSAPADADSTPSPAEGPNPPTPTEDQGDGDTEKPEAEGHPVDATPANGTPEAIAPAVHEAPEEHDQADTDEGGVRPAQNEADHSSAEAIEAEDWDAAPAPQAKDGERPGSSNDPAIDQETEAEPIRRADQEDDPALHSFDFGAEGLSALERKTPSRKKQPHNEFKEDHQPIHQADRARTLLTSLPEGKKQPSMDETKKLQSSGTPDARGGHLKGATLHCKNQEGDAAHPASESSADAFGPLAKAILKGLEKQGKDSSLGTEGVISLSAQEAVHMAHKGGLQVHDLDVFLQALGHKPQVLKGIEVVRGESGRIERIAIRRS